MARDIKVGRRFSGAIYQRGSAGYEQARQDAVWNGRKPDRYPEVILVASDVADVIEGVNFAARTGLRIGIRSGGHSVVATGIRDGGMLLDLSRLNSIQVDAGSKTAWIGPGVLGGQLGVRLSQDGLTFPYGGSATVGLGGFLLTGGYGLNGKTYGSGASNIKAIDVVTADGQLIRADENVNTDYLWAARGAGYGFFGVVVGIQVQLYTAPRDLTLGAYVFPVQNFDEFADWFFSTIPRFDQRLTTQVFGLRMSMLDDRRVVRINALGFGDTPGETRELFRPLEESPIKDLMVLHQQPAAVTLGDIWAGVDRMYPKGIRYFADTVWLKDPAPPGLAAALKPAFETIPTGGSHVMMNPWIPETGNQAALSGTTSLPFHLYGMGRNPSDDEMLHAWIDSSMEPVLAFSSGVGKINESDLQRRDQPVLAPASAARLEQLRDRFDPQRRFHSYLRNGDQG
jgi:FAD/FMN-containing dehydrogenase